MADDVICLQSACWPLSSPAVKPFSMLPEYAQKEKCSFAFAVSVRKRRKWGGVVRRLKRKNSTISAPQTQTVDVLSPCLCFRNPSGFSWDLSSLCLVLASKAESPLSYSLPRLFQVSHSETPSLDWLFTSSWLTQSLTSFYPHSLLFIAFNTLFSLIPSTWNRI